MFFTLQRHAPEIFGSVLVSAIFSLFSTAIAGRVLGLPGDITRALVPRSVTVALVSHIRQGNIKPYPDPN